MLFCELMQDAKITYSSLLSLLRGWFKIMKEVKHYQENNKFKARLSYSRKLRRVIL